MLRLSVALVAALALAGVTAISISPALAGPAYDKCMANCKKGGISPQCPKFCESRYSGR